MSHLKENYVKWRICGSRENRKWHNISCGDKGREVRRPATKIDFLFILRQPVQWYLDFSICHVYFWFMRFKIYLIFKTALSQSLCLLQLSYVFRNILRNIYIYILMGWGLSREYKTKHEFSCFAATSTSKTENEPDDGFRAKCVWVTRVSLSSGNQIKCSKRRRVLLLLLPVRCYLIVDKKQKRNADDSSALTVWRDKK